MSVKFAFAGFRHAHIFSLYNLANETEGIEVVAACEEDAEARNEVKENGSAEITHESLSDMLDNVECDVVAVGDYYGARGKVIIEAMEQGKHVIADKPICTSLDELNKIEKLSIDKSLRVGCMLDMKDNPAFATMKAVITRGDIGEIQAINFGGQHPLSMNKGRPRWYFELGKHGGTINDIAIHALDFIPWITGTEFTVINAARSWNAFVDEYPHFHDAGQVMLTMSNGCGVFGDVSYFIPDSLGYSGPFYWRMTFFGRDGILETSAKSDGITIARNGENEIRQIALGAGTPGGYLQSFMTDLLREGPSEEGAPTTETILKSSRITLKAQLAGIEGQREVKLP